MGVVANVLAEPAMPPLLALAFATAGLSAVSPGAAAILAWVNGWIAEYIALCARAVGSLPFAQVRSPSALVALAGLLVLAAYAWRRWPRS
jgi:hypothetical protein